MLEFMTDRIPKQTYVIGLDASLDSGSVQIQGCAKNSVTVR